MMTASGWRRSFAAGVVLLALLPSCVGSKEAARSPLLRRPGRGKTLVAVVAFSPTSDPASKASHSLLDDAAVQDAVKSYLQAHYPVESVGYCDSPDLKTIVFVPYGAVPAAKGTRFRLFGAVCSETVLSIGPVPVPFGPDDVPGWLDVEMNDGGPRVVAWHSIEKAWFDRSLDKKTSATRQVPDWVLDRIPKSSRTGIDLDERSARPATLKLIQAWAANRVVPGEGDPLPAGYTGAPHRHRNIGSQRALSVRDHKSVLRPTADSYSWDTAFDHGSGPDPKKGPVRLFSQVGNCADDHAAILNKRTRQELRTTFPGGLSLDSPRWRGRTLVVDLVTDTQEGPAASGLHCEIDWRDMKVLRVVPYGPLAPF